MNTVYIEGASTAFGMLDLEMGGWPNRLHVATLREITSLEELTVVTNRSLPGRTLPAILRDVEANMERFRRLGPVAAVLQTGMNEAKIFRGSTSPLVPARLFGEQLTRFCTIAQQQHCSPVLIGPQPIDTTREHPTFSGAIIKDELLVEYGDIMRGIAADTGAPYVDTRAVFAGTGRAIPELLAVDGYHPNELGHAALAVAVQHVLPFES